MSFYTLCSTIKRKLLPRIGNSELSCEDISMHTRAYSSSRRSWRVIVAPWWGNQWLSLWVCYRCRTFLLVSVPICQVALLWHWEPIPGRTGYFSSPWSPHRPWGPPASFPVSSGVLSSGENQTGREANHLPPSNAEVKSLCNHTSSPSICLLDLVRKQAPERTLFPPTFLLESVQLGSIGLSYVFCATGNLTGINTR